MQDNLTQWDINILFNDIQKLQEIVKTLDEELKQLKKSLE